MSWSQWISGSALTAAGVAAAPSSPTPAVVLRVDRDPAGKRQPHRVVVVTDALQRRAVLSGAGPSPARSITIGAAAFVASSDSGATDVIQSSATISGSSSMRCTTAASTNRPGA